jgi:hypothetical protein
MPRSAGSWRAHYRCGSASLLADQRGKMGLTHSECGCLGRDLGRRAVAVMDDDG